MTSKIPDPCKACGQDPAVWMDGRLVVIQCQNAHCGCVEMIADHTHEGAVQAWNKHQALRATRDSLRQQLDAAGAEITKLWDEVHRLRTGSYPMGALTLEAFADLGFRGGDVRAGIGAMVRLHRAYGEGPESWIAECSNPFGGNIQIPVIDLGQLRDILRVLAHAGPGRPTEHFKVK